MPNKELYMNWHKNLQIVLRNPTITKATLKSLLIFEDVPQCGFYINHYKRKLPDNAGFSDTIIQGCAVWMEGENLRCKINNRFIDVDIFEIGGWQYVYMNPITEKRYKELVASGGVKKESAVKKEINTDPKKDIRDEGLIY